MHSSCFLRLSIVDQVISGTIVQVDSTTSRPDVIFLAPTGSGKTVLFELAIVKMLREAAGTGMKVKCVYIAPTKVLELRDFHAYMRLSTIQSLCTEKASDWQSKFAPFGAKCK